MIGRVSIQVNAIKCSDVFLEGVDKNKKRQPSQRFGYFNAEYKQKSVCAFWQAFIEGQKSL